VIISSGGGGGDGGGGGGTYIYSYFEPPEITMVPDETRTFKVKVFDDAGNEVTDSSSYTFSLTRNDVGEIINHSGNTVTFRAGSEIGRFENLIKVNVKYGDLTDFSYATVGVIQNFDQNTDWFLKPSFYHLNMYLDEGIKVFFYPYAIIQKGQAAYSDKVKVNITLTDESAGTIVQTGNDWVIFKPAKEGCFPNLFKGEFDYYGQTHTAFAGVNVAPKDPLSSMAQYAPKIDFVTLQKFSVINKDKVTQFVPQIFDPLSRRIPLISPYFSFDGSGNPVWIPSIYRFTLNKSELGSISSQGFLDVKEGVQAGDYSQAINLSYSHRGEVYNNTWDLKVLADYPAWYISPLPDKLKLPPNTIFYLFHPQDEYQDAFSDYNFGYYEVDADPSALYQYQPFLAVFKTGNVAGTYEKAITLEGTYSSGGKREISLEIDPQMSLDACAGGIVIPPNLPTPPKKIDVWPKVVGTLASFFQKPFNNFWLTALALLLPIPALINLLNRLFAKYPHWLSQLGLPAVPQARIHGKILAYDYDSKKPLALAKLLVYSYPDRHLVSQTLSNNKGEFILSIPQGNYFLNVQKGGYKPLEIIRLDAKSTFVQGRSDGYYDDIYYPEEIVSIKPKEKQALSLSMPMVLEKKSKIKGLGKTLVGFLRKYSLVFLIIGTVLSLAAFLSSPHQLFNNIILFYYMVLWAFEVYFFVFVGTGIAKVVDKSGKPIPLVLARAFDLKNNLAEIAVSDQNGLLQFSLSPGQYIFKFKKPGFGMKVLPLEFKSLKQLGDMEIVMEEKKR